MSQLRFHQASGVAAVFGAVLWFLSVAWYAGQPIGNDGLKEGWEGFNRLITLIPVLFTASMVAIHREQHHHPLKRWYVALRAVVGATAMLAGARLLVDLGFVPSPVAFVAIIAYAATFLWWLIESLRADKFPRLPLIALLLTTLLMLTVIGTDSKAIWLATPFAVAWAWIGYALFSVWPESKIVSSAL